MQIKSQTMAFHGRNFRSLLAGGVGLSLIALSAFSGSRAAHAQDGPPPGQDGGGPGGGGFGGGPGGGGFGGPGGGGGGFGGGQGGFGGGPGGMMGRMGGGGISQVPFTLLVSQLGLSDDQQGKVAIVLIEARDANEPAGGPGQGGGQRQGQGQGQRGNGRAMEEATQKKVAALLNDDQNTKLKSLLSAMRTLQSAGIPARAATKLNLTSDQITTLAAAAPADPQAGGQRGDFQAMQKNADAAKSAVKSTLSSEQLSQVSTYMNRQQGGGPGGPGGGGFGGGQGGFGGGPGGGQGGPGGDGPPQAGGGNF